MREMSSYMVMGVNTDVGKTFVICHLIRIFNDLGCTISAIKPVITGVTELNDISTDTYKIAEALKMEINDYSLSNISPWVFKEPLSPNHAARLENKYLSDEDILKYCNTFLNKEYDIKLVELAGGIMSPITDNYTCVHIAKKLDIPIILVSDTVLGSISACLSAVEVAKVFNLNIKAIILNSFKREDYVRYMKDSIEKYYPEIPIYIIGYKDNNINELRNLAIHLS